MSRSQESWDSFSPEVAEAYLKSFGHPAPGSKQILLDLVRGLTEHTSPSILDLGCGNGQLLEFFKRHGLQCAYTGVDFSESLLSVARHDHPDAHFILGDVNKLPHLVIGPFDCVIYSHVIEMLESPELSLHEARRLTKKIFIRFFEPPEFEVDTVELREMELGRGRVPYLRRKMSRDHYRLILSHIGCSRVDVYRDASKDQVHVLHFGSASMRQDMTN